MDYKYIEQLLERYFQCETTLKEEEILRAFFMQEDVPVWLAKYKTLFVYEAQREESLGNDFDERILEMVEQQEPVKARVGIIRRRSMPSITSSRKIRLTCWDRYRLRISWKTLRMLL